MNITRMDCGYRVLYSMIAVQYRNYILTLALSQQTSVTEWVSITILFKSILGNLINIILSGLFDSQPVANIFHWGLFDLLGCCLFLKNAFYFINYELLTKITLSDPWMLCECSWSK